MAISTYGTLVNLFGNKILGHYNNAALYWSVIACTIISIIILACTGTNREFTSAEFVFTSFANETGYSNGVAWILGLLQSALSLIGYDVVLHMTEEMPRPRIDAPKAMMLAIIVGGITWAIPLSVSHHVLTFGQRNSLHPCHALLSLRSDFGVFLGNRPANRGACIPRNQESRRHGSSISDAGYSFHKRYHG